MSTLNGHRDGNGRFAVGNGGGPGRPRRSTEQDYLIAVSEAVPPERLRKIAGRAADAAENGDAKARQWISDILVGRRATTSMTLTLSEKEDEPNLSVLTDDEWNVYIRLYDRIASGLELSADDAQTYVRLTAKSLSSDEQTRDMFDGEGDD